MECGMMSAENMAAVKTAIEICNNPELRREILCAPGSVYDTNKDFNAHGNKTRWQDILEKKASLENIGIAKQLQEKVMGLVLLVGMRMLTWAEYHEGTLGLSREYSANFLSSFVFTQQGIIDNKKAAEELMKDESLNTKQKYKLACLYCFTDHIPFLFFRMSVEEINEDFYDAERLQRIKQPAIVQFWSYYLIGQIDRIKGPKNLDQYRLDKAVRSGSKAAVEYCLERTNLRRKKGALVYAAREAVKCRNRAERYTRKDLVVFENQRYRDSEKLWVPSDYYVDILSFLLSKMREDQQIEFLKKDIEVVEFRRNCLEISSSIALGYLLDWPYQGCFMEKTKLMWEYLPGREFAVLLLKICNRIEFKEVAHLKYGEEKSYDYRWLLREFWQQSPDHFKRYVFNNEEEIYIIGGVSAVVGLLTELLTLKNFTNEDRENIKLILASATGNEKELIFSSEVWEEICLQQMGSEKWEMLNRFVLNCFLSKEEEYKFKRELSLTKGAKRVCIDFVEKDKWNAVESFIKWSSFSEEEINKLKKEMIYSEEGRDACVDLISPDKKLEAVDKFIRWCFASEEEMKAFKKELVCSAQGTCVCASLVKKDQLELVSEFINFCLSSGGEISELKKSVAFTFGSSVCEELISDSEGEEIYDDRCCNLIRIRIKFKGGKWEAVEKFLTWCFSSEEEIRDFKKNRLLKESGVEIHFNLIKSNQWEEAETFFAWLGLSAEEIKELKKETLFNYGEASAMFRALMYSEVADERFVDYGSKQEAIELLLRWYLTDKETVFEFNEKFKRCYQEDLNEEDEDVLKDFDLAIVQRLNNIENEKMGIKRKSEYLPPNKKLCDLELKNK